MRSLSIGIMKRKGAKQSRRYWGRNFPSLSSLMSKVSQRSEETLGKAHKGELLWEHADSLQKCLIVASQVLVPPMRGKPFWSLSLNDDGDNSVLFLGWGMA